MHRKRQTRPTLLIFGEGDCEVAFLRHLKSNYCAGGSGVNVTICNANGKGPGNVIKSAAGRAGIYAYDQCAALLDTDIPWSDKVKKSAHRSRVEMIGSSPCLEGLLLRVLEKPVPETSPDCKKSLQQLLGVDLTESDHYASRFTKDSLEVARQRVEELDRLLRLFEGR